jgi:tetratricopeptide (TPR) repeat protein
MRFLSTLSIGLILLGSCGDPAEKDSEVKKERIPVEISESDIYAANKIMAFLENTTKFVEEANEFFLKGVDSYRNKKNLDSATVYFKRSILKEPSAKAYFELGNVYFDKKKYADAEKAYGMAEKLDYQPFSKILYNKACMFSLKEEPEMAGQYLEYAIQAGYINLDHIEKDPDLENLRETYHFKRAVDKGLRGMSDAENLYWLQFKKQFQGIDLPNKLKITLKEEEYNNLQFISYDYEKYIAEMRDEAFSREVSKGFYYFGKPYETKEYVALIYMVKDEFMGEYAPILYRVATFTHDGTLIDKQVIAGRELLDGDLWEATLKKNGIIDVVVKEPVYEKDPEEHGYWDNPMVSSKELGKRRFVIKSNGKISEEDQLATN